MKIKYIATIAGIALVALTVFAQPPPNPPNPPPPPGPPPDRHEDRHEKMPKVPVTYLGVETSEVPSVVCEQLGLAKGFGLVVDYVVPDSPAATAGVKQNDIIRMLNDQILTEPDQLAKLVRSYSEGTNVTLTLLRKGKEEKVSAKLIKKEVPQRPEFGPGHHRHSDFQFGNHDFGGFDMSNLKEQMRDLRNRLGDDQRGMIHDAVMKAREEVMRSRDEARRAAGEIQITRNEDGGLKQTKIDIGKAQIVFSDGQGELRIESIDGKKVLTAKDPQGLLLFSGPVETKEDLDKVPAEVRQRYEKLQQKDLPAVVSPTDVDRDDESVDMDNGNDEDEISSLEQVSTQRSDDIPIFSI